MRFLYDGHANEGGIYRITNQTNGRIYIGSTSQFKVRWASHRSHLRRGCHPNPFLQNDFNKCGPDAFVIEVVSVIPNKMGRRDAEEKLIREHFGPGCYNLKSEVEAPLILSPSTREKMRTSHLGVPRPDNSHPQSEETKEKIRQAKLGRKMPLDVVERRNAAIRAAYADPERNRARFESRKGKPHTDEAKAKMRAAVEARRQAGLLKMSDDQREHLRRMNTGKTHGPCSEATREKLRKAWESRPRVEVRGPMREETKEKIRQAKLGKSHTVAAREKMRASRNAYTQRNKKESGTPQ